MFGNRGSRPKKKVYWDLARGEPISPKHQQPQSMGNLADDIDRQFFNDFSEYGEVLNWWLSDKHTGSRWRVQEQAQTELTIGAYDSPIFGRRYDVFCGPTKLGILEVAAMYPYTAQKPNIRASINLTWIRLLSWDTVMDFLGSVAAHVDDDVDSHGNSLRIQNAMNRCLWDSLVIHYEDFGLDWGDLDVTLQGSARFYFDRRRRYSEKVE
jgi:hypothetical protein